MQHLKLTFADIIQKNILYYDKTVENACLNICRTLHIDNMPALDGRHYFELLDNKFCEKEVLAEHRLSVNECIFDDKLIEKFRLNKHNVLFVYDGNVIQGVVHLCDYNRDIVLQAIQDDVLSFERKLRQLILLNGFTNEDMLEFFKHRFKTTTDQNQISLFERKIKSYGQKKIELETLGPFQLFEFSDILNFCSSSFTKKIFKILDYDIMGLTKSGLSSLIELRNLAMHGKNPIAKNEPSIYSLDSLQLLMQILFILRTESYRLLQNIRNHPNFIKTLEMDNKNKLNIIEAHYPNALEYFIGF